MSPSATFVDPALEDRLERDGYVVVDLLDRPAVDRLRALFDDLDHPTRAGFFAANHATDVGYKATMVDAVRAEVAGPLAALLHPHRLIGGFFMVKWPDAASAQPAHLDWALVDEAVHRSVSAWIPLVDTDQDNGALCCLRGSHRLTDGAHRGSPDFPDQDLVGRITEHTDPADHHRIDARAGQAIIYFHQVIHWSGPNLGAAPRPAVNVAVVPSAAPLVHYRLRDDGRVERLEVDDEFFEAWRWGGAPPDPRRVDVVERHDPLTALAGRRIGEDR
ncbi:MAG: phytanoyl-CoA dioxygenase family protein [Acidimicrobiales bacterium]